MFKISNPCFRCGKERIVIRVWKEKIFGSVVTTTDMGCPDGECQKIVDAENRRVTEKSARLRLRSKQRREKYQSAGAKN